MLRVTVDIATRKIGEDEEVYVVRPGADFSLYRDFAENSAVFLDFPDLLLPPSELPASRRDLRPSVARSMAIRDWYRRRQPGRGPSRNLAEYERQIRGRKLGRYTGAVERLFFKMEEGTIVVVPGPGYFSNVLIGKIVGPTTDIKGARPYPDERVPARRVEWVDRREKAEFSEALRNELQRSIPVMVLAHNLRHEIVEASFDQFLIGDEFSSRLRTTKADFSTLDDYKIVSFLNYVCGVLAAVESDQKFAAPMNLVTALKVLEANRDLVPELNSNINSPGALRLFSQSVVVIAASALLAVALSGCKKPDEVHVINTAGGPDDQCAIDVQQKASTAVKMMDLDTWEHLCLQAREAAKETGLTTGVKVIQQSGKQ